MPTSPFLRALILTCAVLATSVAPGGWLVCLGSDGHFALEAVAGNCTDEPHGTEAGEEPCSLGDCGPCLDTPLGGAALLRPDADHGADVGLDLVVLPRVTSGPAAAAAAASCRLPAQASPYPAIARHLRTTLLRC